MSNLNLKIFKAYDIRGIYQEDFDEKHAYLLGLAFIKLRQEELKRGNLKIVVACDMRLSSPILKKNLIQGILDAGADVIDIGLASTPTFYFAVANYHYDGGIIVSASHNPKEYNGFKLVREKALPVSGENGINILRDLIIENKLIKADKIGNIEFKNNILADQIQRDLRYVNLKKIKPLKIVIDPANAMGSQYFDELFKFIPQCEVIKMNWELDGTFPVHEADPFKLENVRELGEKIKQEKADLGITTDGDGDRIFFVDEKGEPLEGGITRAILCKLFLRDFPEAKIAYDIRPGRITRDIILENNGLPVVTRVGHSLIKEQTILNKCVFAGESSGHFFLNMNENGCYEVPVIIALKILEELSLSSQTFSEYILPFKKYFHSGEINLKVLDQDTKIEILKKRYAKGRQNELDGLTVEYPEWWFNVRKSNTEPILRLNLEAVEEEIMIEKRDEILNLIMK